MRIVDKADALGYNMSPSARAEYQEKLSKYIFLVREKY
jgi:hypothetical protein